MSSNFPKSHSRWELGQIGWEPQFEIRTKFWMCRISAEIEEINHMEYLLERNRRGIFQRHRNSHRSTRVRILSASQPEHAKGIRANSNRCKWSVHLLRYLWIRCAVHFQTRGMENNVCALAIDDKTTKQPFKALDGVHDFSVTDEQNGLKLQRTHSYRLLLFTRLKEPTVSVVCVSWSISFWHASMPSKMCLSFFYKFPGLASGKAAGMLCSIFE